MTESPSSDYAELSVPKPLKRPQPITAVEQAAWALRNRHQRAPHEGDAPRKGSKLPGRIVRPLEGQIDLFGNVIGDQAEADAA